MKANSVTDSTVLRTDQSSCCLLAAEIDLNCVPKWALIKSEDGLLIAISKDSQILPTDLFVYLWGWQDVTRTLWPLSGTSGLVLLFESLLGWVEFLAFNPCTEEQMIGFWLFVVAKRLWCCDSCSRSEEIWVIGELSGRTTWIPARRLFWVSLTFMSFN